MERFDKLVVLDQGRIIDTGTHGELAERCVGYASLSKTSSFTSESPSSDREVRGANKP